MKINILKSDIKEVEAFGWLCYHHIENNQQHAYDVGHEIISNLLDKLLYKLEDILKDVNGINRKHLLKTIETANFLINKIN